MSSLFSSRARRSITVDGSIPGAPHEEANLLRLQIKQAADELVDKYRPSPFQLVLRYGESPHLSPAGDRGESGNPSATTEKNAAGNEPPEFIAIDPIYQFEQLVLAPSTLERLLDCVSFVEVAPLVFDEWGLRKIEPHPSIAVNFRGPPGTGKTMAAHAAASHLGKKIMLSRLSDLESKYHGQGPKNLVGLFQSAQNQGAVVFIDEAESLLSRRFAQPEQAAESAINSMRTELLMALDSFDGLVIFASNLPHSYDVAMESRLLHVDFELPHTAARRQIWSSHLLPTLPVEDDVSLDRLAAIDGVSGRDIKFAVISAAIGTARRKAAFITEELLISALERQRRDRSSTEAAKLGADEGITAAIKQRLQSTPAKPTSDSCVPKQPPNNPPNTPKQPTESDRSA